MPTYMCSVRGLSCCGCNHPVQYCRECAPARLAEVEEYHRLLLDATGYELQMEARIRELSRVLRNLCGHQILSHGRWTPGHTPCQCQVCDRVSDGGDEHDDDCAVAEALAVLELPT